MDESLNLSRARLETFLACQRRFYLRYRARLPWPAAPLDPQQETAAIRGQQFHLLLQRRFLNLDVDPDAIADEQLRNWWDAFVEQGPALPNGRYLPELQLSVPVGRCVLSGRFDLVVLGQTAGGAPFAHVFDWKTGSPQTADALRQAWQTRLYLALLAESRGALLKNGQILDPDQAALTYWYVSAPHSPRTLRYSRAAHAQNWAEVRQVVAAMQTQLARADWPLTDDWGQCRACAYQVICRRQAAGGAAGAWDADAEADTADLTLDPHTP